MAEGVRGAAARCSFKRLTEERGKTDGRGTREPPPRLERRQTVSAALGKEIGGVAGPAHLQVGPTCQAAHLSIPIHLSTPT